MAEALEMWPVSVGASPPAGNDASVLAYGRVHAEPVEQELRLPCTLKSNRKHLQIGTDPAL